MGDFRVVIEAVGGHGCQREKGDGEHVVGCESRNCPDCMVRELVRRFKRSGVDVKLAQLHHWPEDLGYDPSGTVIDNLLTGMRQGEFPERARYLSEAKT